MRLRTSAVRTGGKRLTSQKNLATTLTNSSDPNNAWMLSAAIRFPHTLHCKVSRLQGASPDDDAHVSYIGHNRGGRLTCLRCLSRYTLLCGPNGRLAIRGTWGPNCIR